MNFVSVDPALQPFIESYLEPTDRDLLASVLHALAADAAQRLGSRAQTVDMNLRMLEQFDLGGEWVDAITYHNSYRELSRAAYEEYWVSALPLRGRHGWDDVQPHLVKHILS